MEEKKYLSVEEVAKRFGLNLATVYRLAQAGALPGFKLGSQWRFSEKMLESWVADRVTIEWFRAGDRKAELKSTDTVLSPDLPAERLQSGEKH